MDDIFAVLPRRAGNQFRIENSLGKANELGGISDHEVRDDGLVFCFCIHKLRVADSPKPIAGDSQDGTIIIPGMMKVTTPTLADAKQCRLRITIDQVGNYWTVLIFHALSNGSLRFMEIKRAIGTISQRSLTQALRDLEREGYVARKVYPTSPPKVEVPPDTVGTVVAESDEKLAALGWRALGRSARVAEKVR